MAAFVEQTSTTDESGNQIYNTRNHPEDLRVYSSDAAIVPLAAWRRTASHPPPPTAAVRRISLTNMPCANIALSLNPFARRLFQRCDESIISELGIIF